MSKEVKVKVDGKTWKIRFIDRKECPKDRWGDCNDKTKSMRVRTDLSDLHFLDTFIHELLHAAAYKMFSEEWVSDTATDLAKALLKSGYVEITRDDSN